MNQRILIFRTVVFRVENRRNIIRLNTVETGYWRANHGLL